MRGLGPEQLLEAEQLGPEPEQLGSEQLGGGVTGAAGWAGQLLSAAFFFPTAEKEM
jgi:hypothetical protein